jgi:DNA repair protein RAD7
MAPRRQPIPPPAAPEGAAPSRGVTGPNSAMTAFLREQGITAPPRGSFNGRILSSRFVETEDVEDDEEAEVVEQDLTNTNAVASGSGSIASPTVDGKKRKNLEKNVAAMKKKKQAEGQAYAQKKDAPKAGRYDNRAPGAIASCGECGRKFTVTKVSNLDYMAIKDRVKSDICIFFFSRFRSVHFR